MTLIGPLTPGSSTTWGAGFHVWRGDVVGNGAQDPFGFVSRDDALVDVDGPWVLGEDAPSKLQSSKQNLATRLQGKRGGDVKRHRVGCISAVRPDGLGDGSSKLGEQTFCWRRGLNAVESRGKNQCGNTFDFALSAPRPAAKAEAELNGFGDAHVERCAD